MSPSTVVALMNGKNQPLHVALCYIKYSLLTPGTARICKFMTRFGSHVKRGDTQGLFITRIASCLSLLLALKYDSCFETDTSYVIRFINNYIMCTHMMSIDLCTKPFDSAYSIVD